MKADRTLVRIIRKRKGDKWQGADVKCEVTYEGGDGVWDPLHGSRTPYDDDNSSRLTDLPPENKKYQMMNWQRTGTEAGLFSAARNTPKTQNSLCNIKTVPQYQAGVNTNYFATCNCVLVIRGDHNDSEIGRRRQRLNTDVPNEFM